MINRIHAILHRPEHGWDPVPAQYAQRYANTEWQKVDEKLVDALETWLSGLTSKDVLDLGGGPGQYAVAFARRGAKVTWYDVSRNYLQIAQQKAQEHAVDVQFVLGYMDEAPTRLGKQFDLVFNRVCFYYGWSDSSFARVIYDLVKPGGCGYIEANNSLFRREQLSVGNRFRTWLNEHTGIKIGHPHPPRGRIAQLLLRYPLSRLLVEYEEPTTDRILFRKAK